MKALFLSVAAVAALAACGGGGGADPVAQVPTCTYPTVSDPTPIQIGGSQGVHPIADTTKKLSIIITGNQNTVTLDRCVYVESLSISGSMNTISSHSTSRLQGLRFEVNSAMNTVSTTAASGTAVTDLGNQNVVTRH